MFRVHNMAHNRSIKEIARALIELATEERIVPQVLRDLRIVDDVFRADPKFAVDLDETSVALHKRQLALCRALEKSVHIYVLNTLLALQKRELLNEFEALRAAAVKDAELLAEHREALVKTPIHLTEKEKDGLMKTLQKKFGGTIELEERIDHSLIAGLHITIGDWVIDNSVTGKLERLTHALYV